MTETEFNALSANATLEELAQLRQRYKEEYDEEEKRTLDEYQAAKAAGEGWKYAAELLDRGFIAGTNILGDVEPYPLLMATPNRGKTKYVLHISQKGIHREVKGLSRERTLDWVVTTLEEMLKN